MQDLTKLNHYEEIKKISEISNKILKNGAEHLYEEKKLEATFGDSNFYQKRVKEDYHFKRLNFLIMLQKEKDWFLFIHLMKNLKYLV